MDPFFVLQLKLEALQHSQAKSFAPVYLSVRRIAIAGRLQKDIMSHFKRGQGGLLKKTEYKEDFKSVLWI